MTPFGLRTILAVNKAHYKDTTDFIAFTFFENDNIRKTIGSWPRA